MKLKLRQKLILLIESIVILTIVVFSSAAAQLSWNSLVSRLKSHLMSVSVLKKNSITKYIANAEEILNVYINRPEYKELLFQYLTSPKETVKRQQIKKSFVEEITADTRYFKDILFVNKEGEVVLSTNQSDEGKIKSQEVYFREGLRGVYKPHFYYDQAGSKTVIILSKPLLDVHNRIVGLLIGRLDTSEISNILLEKSGLGKTGETFLVNSSHLVITKLLKEKDAELKKTLFLPQIKTCLEGKSNFAKRTDYFGDNVYGYWDWYPELNSCIVTKIDEREGLLPLYQLLAILIGISCVVTIIFGLIGYLSGSYITDPLHKLQDTANKIKEGNFNIVSKDEPEDELGDVAYAMYQMAHKIKDYYAELEKRVQDKTLQLTHLLENAEIQNKSLEDNKHAMLNLLEDSKQLEEELEVEKQSVQQKVVGRTRELSDEKARLTASISSLPHAFLIVNNRYELTLYNSRLTPILGKPDGEWNFQKVNDSLGTEFDLEEYTKEMIKGKKEMREKEILVGSKYLKIFGAPIIPERLADADNILGSIITITDVTEERLLQRSKDEFFSIASHELRTPLTAIRGNTSMILDYYDKELTNQDVKSTIKDTHDASIRLIAIVNDFLDMSRLEQRRIEFVNEPFDIEKLIEDALKEYQVTGSRLKIALVHTKSKEKLPLTFADKNRVRQVIINLIGNALKFTEKGEVILSTKRKGEMIEVYVEDTGKGIAPAYQGLLFHKFQQAGDSIVTRDSTQGTGLGLYISNLMIKGMGGKIWLVKSEVGKGTTFAFSLPIVPSEYQMSSAAQKTLGFTPLSLK